METCRELLRSQRVCRFCLTREEPLSSIYERSLKTQNSVPLPLQIMACVAIEAFPSDGMPVTICSICRHFMDQSYRFKQICRQADEALRQFISSGDLRGPIDWPMDMLKSLPPGKVKIDDLELSEDENEEANISKEAEKEAECELPASKDGSNESPIQTFSFPCNMCERSYPLKQLLEIHLQKNHHERTYQCNVCPNKFFTKYDLQKHLLVHTGANPYECVVCQKKFARHEKIHSEIPLMMYSSCDASFFSAEELEAHTVIHQRQRPYKCSQCLLLFYHHFTFKQGLLRHENVHLEQHPHKCNYCTESFRTINMLARHVQAHAEQRPYPCKYCSRSFLLPHHYTRHLRICHADAGWRNKAPGHARPGTSSSFEPHLIYKCEQCGKTFDKQDDLIFHSAIHANQNLTCPLCKDKFENIDDVTEHIKSYAEGSYICDWCELMFNSESRLDTHVDEAHGDTVLK